MAYPYMVLHRRRWIVRMVVPTDLRALIGQSAFCYSTGEGDQHAAYRKAAPIIEGLQARIRRARLTQRSPIDTEAQALAATLQAKLDDPVDHKTLIKIAEIVVRERGQRWGDIGAQMNRNGPFIEHAVQPAIHTRIDAIAALPRTTSFLHYFEQWKPHAGLKPRPLDQAISSLTSFDAAVKQSIETLEAKHVQTWIDAMIGRPPETIKSKAGKVSIIMPPKAKTVARKLGEVRNYWRYLQSLEIVGVDRDPFAKRRVKDPAERRETSDDKRQKWQPAEVVALWQQAAADGDVVLSNVIRIAAYSGARIEGIAKLRVGDIRTDPATGIRFMHMDDKTIGGDRDVPIHPMIDGLIDDLIKTVDANGYLIESSAGSKYTERGAPIGQRFGRLKTRLGYDRRFVYHSIRKTLTSMMQDASVAEGVTADIIGHIKPGLTYGLYGGITKMSLRAGELARAIIYPVAANGEVGTASSIT